MVWRRLAQKSKIPQICINSMKLHKNHENSVKSVNFGASEPTCSKPYIILRNSNGSESSAKAKIAIFYQNSTKNTKSDKIINKFAFPASAELSKPLELLRIM